MKKIIMVFVLCFTFLMLGCKASAEEIEDKIMNMEVGNGSETVAQRVDTLAHMALFMNDNINMKSYLSETDLDSSFGEILTDLAYKGRELDSSTYKYLTGIIDIMGLEGEIYYEPFSISNTMYTKKKTFTRKDDFQTIFRITYDSPNEYISIDIPYADYGNGKIDINPYKAVVTVKNGGRSKVINVETQEAQFYYLIVKAIEDIYYYEYEMGESSDNSVLEVGFDAFPNVTDEKILNQSIEKEIDSYSDKDLKKLSGDYYIRYTSFDKNDKLLGEKYVYFISFGKGDYTYRVSCSRDGILSLNVYAGSGGFLYYTIPNLEYPYDILTESMETGEQTLLNFSNLSSVDEENLKNIEEILILLKRIPKETSINLGI
ncbi:hypothetical protein IX317_001160 [Fusobacterium sp. DD29]|uniref:hypothetical protein n=1 Tax=unclassified Fusobacterium TaxID=2648384 RepID=UPI001B8B2A2E|nr:MULTISPECIES: hypothetical protein [unclassified Fusobacterium]MBR8749486.1 hypothetical protein [Fusobacterium sp. DD29]MBR8761747.1 hypothetical protein [Fusobacterium sp. DD25]MBR8767765.1 hypothetical protein [Fusobacterium sp. DD43]MBR8771814.1 hypothetical protein [Fusobacterium sp. DD40]MBR8776041.1 hypothetical protein [Fusobacterium sp. DD17]